jgi:hypothetical protein
MEMGVVSKTAREVEIEAGGHLLIVESGPIFFPILFSTRNIPSKMTSRRPSS